MTERFPAYEDVEGTYHLLSQTNYEPIFDALETSVNEKWDQRAAEAGHDEYPDPDIDPDRVLVRNNGALSAEAIVYDDIYGAVRPLANVQLTKSVEHRNESNNQELGTVEKFAGVSPDETGVTINDDLFDLYCTQDGC